MFDNVVRPALHVVNAEVEAVVSQSSLHIKQYASSVDVRKFDAVFVVAGDGTLHEFLNAYAREHQDGLDHFKKTPLCPVPVGTCNGLAASLGFWSPCQAVERALSVLSGKTSARAFDLYSVERVGVDGCKLLDFHAMYHGMFADVDLTMERWTRWLPQALRADICPILLLLMFTLRLRARHAHVLLYPKRGEKPVDVSGEFLNIGIQNVAWTDSQIQLTPAAKMDDGLLHVCLWRKGPSRLGAALTLLAMTDTLHVNKPHMSFHTAQVIEFAPSSGEMDICGTGESGLPPPLNGRIRLELLPSAICMT